MDEHFKTKAGSRKRKKEALFFEPKDCYTIGEIAKKFHINDCSVFKHIRRHSIPTRQIGNYVYVPKSEIDKLYKSLWSTLYRVLWFTCGREANKKAIIKTAIIALSGMKDVPIGLFELVKT